MYKYTILYFLLLSAMSSQNLNHLVGYWPFNENNDSGLLLDESQNQYHGWLNGGEYTNIISHDYLDNFSFFGGTAGVQPFSVLPFHDTGLTASVWLRAQDGTHGYKRIIMNYNNDTNFREGLLIYMGETGEIIIEFDGNQPDWGGFSSPINTLQPNIWYHVAVTHYPYDPNSALTRLYVNGEFVQEGNTGHPNIQVTDGQPFQIGGIGALSYGQFDPWYGYIDEVSIWKYAMSQEEIQSLMYLTPSFLYDSTPFVQNPIEDLTLNLGTGMQNSEATINLDSVFADPNDDILSYSIESWNGNNIIDVSLSGSYLNIVALSVGFSTILISATDPDGFSVTSEVSVEVVMPASIASVEVGTVQGYTNSEISVPVHIDLIQESVSSIEISFSGFQDHIEFLDLELEGAMVGDAEWDVVLNSQEDLLLTLAYGANEISGEGLLFHLRFNIPEEIDTDFVPIMIEYVHLDELEGDIELLNGGVEVNAIVWGDVSQNGDVSGYDASLVLKYLVGTEELDENQLFVSDVTQDATVSALDASAIAQYVVQLIDVLPLDDLLSVNGGGEFYVNNTEMIPGEILEIPIELANGENLLSFEFSAEYDESVFTLEEIVWSELINHFTIEDNLVPGSINIAGMGTTPDGEEGTFGTIRMYVNPNFSDQNTSFNISYRINESAPIENINVLITNSILGTDNSLIPKVFALHQNYPNPFNPTTQIKYDLPKDQIVNITIYDVMGRNIRTLINSNKQSGYHSIHWDAKNNVGEGVAAGMYIYIIKAGEFRSTKKMVLLK